MNDHICTLCGWHSRLEHVCAHCRLRLSGELRELADLARLLAVVRPERPQSHAEHVSGTRDPALPVNLLHLDLVAPGCLTAIADPYGDQIGHASIASVLSSWALDFSTQLGLVPTENSTVERLTPWLREHLDEACDRHPAIADFSREIRTLLPIARSVLALNKRKTRYWKPCPGCDVMALTRSSGDEWIECGNCKRLYTQEELEYPS